MCDASGVSTPNASRRRLYWVHVLQEYSTIEHSRLGEDARRISMRQVPTSRFNYINDMTCWDFYLM
jgi:hypothetical protein